MTFKQLLKLKDDAVAAYEKADASLSEALEIYTTAQTDLAAATQAVEAAHKALADELTEKGHHATHGADGTITVFHATDKVPEGWASYHPVLDETE